MKNIVKLSITAFLLAGAIGMILAASIINKAYLMFIVAVPVMMFVVTIFKITATSDVSFENPGDPYSSFISGFFIAGTFGVIICLRHVKEVETVNIVLACIAVGFALAAAAIGFQKSSDDIGF